MRKNIFTLAFVVIVWGMIGIISPVSALPAEEELLPLYEGFSDNRVGNIVIDPANAHFAILANVGEQNGSLYYEPDGVQPIRRPRGYHLGHDKSKQEWTSAFQ